MSKTARAWPEQGFSMVEMMIVIAIIGIVSAMATVAFINELPMIRADTALERRYAQLRQARESAVDQRSAVTVTFQGTGEMVVCTSKLFSGYAACPNSANGQSELGDDVLDPSQMTYSVLTGVGDTPDNFNTISGVFQSYAVFFYSGVSGDNPCGSTPALPCTITFRGDGTVVDANGNYITGTIFMGQPGNTGNPTNPLTARAVTILGTTGRIKGYKYNGKAWF